MQRIISILILVLLTTYCNATENEIKVNTTISEVTVYQQNALIHREGTATVPVGNSIIVIHNLNSNIRPQDVRINSKGDFSILSITYRYHTDTLSGRNGQKERDVISQEIYTLRTQIDRENGYLDIYNKEEQMLMANQNFTHKEEGVDIDRLEKASNFMRTRLFDIRKKRLEIHDLVVSLQLKIDELNLKQSKIKGLNTKSTLEMIVRVNAESQVKGTFIMDYRVHNAGWLPSYDATVDKVTDPLILEYKAKVYQNTGENWDNVTLTIATGNPNINKKKPNLLPWYVSGTVPQRSDNYNLDLNQFLRSQPYNAAIRNVRGQVFDQNGESLPFVSIQIYGSAVATTTDINGYYSINIPANNQQIQYAYTGHTNDILYISNSVMNVILKSQSNSLNEVVISSESNRGRKFNKDNKWNGGVIEMDMALVDADTGYAEVSVAYSMTNTKFKIDAKYTIPSDGKEYAVQIQKYEMDADYVYQCTPKLDPTAYLTAQITGWEDYNLLIGPMNIYFENAFIGQSQLDLNNAGDTLSLSMGEDKSISVVRTRVKAENKKQVLGGHKKVIREWEYTVRNNKREPITIVIDDQLPITTTEEIEIDTETLSGGKINELTGKVVWEMKLDSSKKKSFKFKYSVKYPKNMYLRL